MEFVVVIGGVDTVDNSCDTRVATQVARHPRGSRHPVYATGTPRWTRPGVVWTARRRPHEDRRRAPLILRMTCTDPQTVHSFLHTPSQHAQSAGMRRGRRWERRR